MAANIRISQVVTEVATEASTTGALRITQIAAEVVTEAAAAGALRISQIAVEVLVEFPPAALFTATAEPRVSFMPWTTGMGTFAATAAPEAAVGGSAALIGILTATALPQAFFVSGFVQLTASPQGMFTGINTAYTAMTFSSTAEPRAEFNLFVPQGFFLATAWPQLKWFPQIGQTVRCSSGTGAPAAEVAIPRNAVY